MTFIRLNIIMTQTKKKVYGAGRTRNYATMVYPDSAPNDWMTILADIVVPCFISPIHDRDFNSDGEDKKPHYHVLLCYDGPKTQQQAKNVFDKIGGVGVERVESLRGYARYLCHMDNPEKAQYSIEDVISLGGADYSSAISLITDKYKAIGEMIDYCQENNVIMFSDLLEYSRMNRYDWFRILCDNGTCLLYEYLRSREYRNRYVYDK